MLIQYSKKTVSFEKRFLARPEGTYGIVNPDYNQVWKLADKFGKMLTLKNLDRNSRNEILQGKKQGSGYNAPSGQSVPATARFLDDKFVNFFEQLQDWFHYTLNAGKTSDAQAKKDFANCFRDNAWMTNNAGTWTRADYINKNGKPPYIQLQPMATGGDVLRIIGEISYKRQPALVFEAINPEYNFMNYLASTHRWLFFRPKNSARVQLKDKKGYVVGYNTWYSEPSNSWYGEKMEVPIFGFIKASNLGLQSTTGWCNIIEKTRVRILKTGEAIPNPYIMRDGRIMENPYENF